MRNKTAMISQILQPLIRLTVRTLLLFPKPVFLGFLRGIRRVFNRSFSELFLDECLGRYMYLGYASIPVAELSLEATIPVNLNLDLGDYIQRSFYLFGYPPFTGELLKFCDQRTAFFDIGANLGIITLAVAKHTPANYLFAFEPEPGNFAKLKANLLKNCPEARAFQLGLSDTNGKIEMKSLDYDSGSASFEIGYLETRMHDYKCHSKSTMVKVDVATFDSVITDIDLSNRAKVAMKIDVEGHELAVLRGMRAFFQRSTQEICIVIETHKKNFSEVQKTLTGERFAIAWPPAEELEAFWSGDASAIDLVFIRP